MGMEFVPVYSDEAGEPTGSNGLATVKIDAAKQQLMGMRTGAVARKPIAATIRTVGRVTIDETRVHHLHTKYDAYVEHVHPDANFIGAFVKKGEPLLTLYSPDLYATEQEYLLALRAQRRLGASGTPGVARQGEDLLEAARQRLLLWDLAPSDIANLEKTGQASRTFDLYAPASGFVTAKTATHGMKVGPADSLFDIADLSHLWVFADVYEAELPRVAVGQMATMTLSYWPGKSWTGKVTYVFPTVDEKTRTVKVRVELDNPGAQLKPEMYADIVLQGAPRMALVVPEDAVIETGTRSVVFLSLGEGKLEPREVRVGQRSEGFVEVLSGVKEGDAIALGASFLVDSESRLKAALQAYTAAPKTGAAPEKKP
jgi:Cu(I)/Ag(I) efflux system membrane fusion protein